LFTLSGLDPLIVDGINQGCGSGAPFTEAGFSGNKLKKKFGFCNFFFIFIAKRY
jgi:hypothetical protein